MTMGYERIGWFDAFRAHGAPTWYGDNRTPVVTDTTTLGIVLVFAVFLVSFLIILPGIRRERWSSLISVVVTLSVGSVLLVTIHHPGWHVGNVKIYAPYRAFTTEKLDAFLGVRVGLRHVNITLRSSDVRHSENLDLHLDYNERFHLNAVHSMEKELVYGLSKGLPYPVLSVIEYLSVDRAGFIWGRQYRLAGYYTSIMLWFCVVLWCIQVLLLCFVPSYYARSCLVVGLCMWLTDAVYVLCCPRRMAIRFPDIGETMPVLDFRLGWCFWAIVITGAVCVVLGAVLRVLELKSIYKFVTFLEPDFDMGQRRVDTVPTSSGSSLTGTPQSCSPHQSTRRRPTQIVSNTATKHMTSNHHAKTSPRCYDNMVIVDEAVTSPPPVSPTTNDSPSSLRNQPMTSAYAKLPCLVQSSSDIVSASTTKQHRPMPVLIDQSRL